MKQIKAGSAATNQLVLNHPSVSPDHLEIILDDQGNVWVTDLNSLYGTFVNNLRIQGTVRLQPADQLRAAEVPVPWQNYIYSSDPAVAVPFVAPSQTTLPGETPAAPPRKKRTLLIAGSAVLGVLLLGAGILYWYTRASYQHLKFIPSDAFAVVSVNFKSISGKMDLDRIKNLEMIKDMKDLSKDKNAMSDILADPMSSGIDIFSQPYAFFTMSHGDYPTMEGGVVFSLKSGNDFYNFIDKNVKGHQIEMIRDFNYIRMDGGSCLCWNNSGGIWLFGHDRDEQKEYCETLLHQRREESILSVASFDKFKNANFDIGAYLNYQGLSRMPFITLPSWMRGNAVMAGITFSDGKLNYYSENLLSDAGKIPQMMKNTGINEELKKSIPGNSYAVASLSLDLDGLYKYMNEQDNTQQMLDQLADNLHIQRSELPGIFSGDVYFALTDIKKDIHSFQYPDYDYETEQITYETYTDTTLMPQFLAGATVKNEKAFSKLLERLHPSDTTAGAKYWQMGAYVKTYLVHHGSSYFFTNDFSTAGKLAVNGTTGTTFSGEAADLVSSSPFAGYFNLDYSKYPACIPPYLEKNMGGKDYEKFVIVAKIFKYATMNGDSKKQNVDIYFNDPRSCLNLFFDTANELYLKNQRY